MPREARTLDQQHYAEMLIEKRDDGVALITLNRPERHNASTAIMHAEFTQLPGDIQADPDVRAAVITGAGRSFCSGADVQQRLGGGGDGMSPLDVLGEPRRDRRGLPQQRQAGRHRGQGLRPRLRLHHGACSATS